MNRQATRAAPLPSDAPLPLGTRPPRPARVASVMLDRPSAIEAEAIRGLRTRIVAQHVREGRRALAICAPSRGSGCSFVATNLAIAFSQIGTKTALLDADLRSPALAGLFGLPDTTPGLADYLATSAMRPEEVAMSEVLPNLSLITAGTPSSTPQELLSSDRFRALVNQLLREYELTIIDTSPANVCTDGQRVATIAGYSLIVARKHRSYMSDVATLSRTLRADRSVIVGAVLNDH